MLVIGLTGGIACGKTTLSGELRSLGALVIDADAISRELTGPEGAALPEIRQLFGDKVFTPNGALDRRALGSIVFSSDEQRRLLEGIIHPLVLKEMTRRLEIFRQSGASVCVLDVPLLYETGFDSLCDQVWCAYLPKELQLSRLMARDGLTRAEGLARMASQMPLWEKAERADRVIDTSGSIAASAEKIHGLWAGLSGGREHSSNPLSMPG